MSASPGLGTDKYHDGGNTAQCQEMTGKLRMALWLGFSVDSLLRRVARNCGINRLRICGSGVQIPQGAPIKMPVVASLCDRN